MAKRSKNKFAAPIPSMNSTKENSFGLTASLEESQKNSEFERSLSTEAQEPKLSNDIQKNLNDEQLNEFNSLKKEYKSAVSALKDLTDSNQRTQKEYETKLAKLKEKEDLLASEKTDLETKKTKYEQDQQNFKAMLSEKQTEISQKLDNLDKLERDLIIRETDAANGFAELNQQALLNLKNQIGELQARQTREQNKLREIQASIIERKHLAEQELLQKEQDFLQEKEDFIKKESELTRKQRRLDDEFRELKFQQTEIRNEIEQEFLREQEKLSQEIERLNKKLQKSYDENDVLQNQISEFVDFREVLERLNQSPNELMYELNQKQQEIINLKAQIDNNNDEALRGQLNFYQQENRGLKNKNDELELDLASKSKELSQLKLGVADKETLETEKRVLNKQKDVLQLRINELTKTVDDLINSQLAETPFPQMKALDETKMPEVEWRKIQNLADFAVELQHRIAQAERGKKLYFRLDDIRFLLAGLAMSQLHIFQGISGTGKTSLAKAFAKAVNGFCTDISVQAGWRDRDDLLGYYNAFEKKFYEKDCLQGLYRASTEQFSNHIHIILLDEMNLSRPEQYFAEFLSALEKNDINDRVITLSESALSNAPNCLIEGRKIRVPRNVWFIGTANHDETTNEFADKTYDRAFVMNLPRNEETFEITKFESASFGYDTLQGLFKHAQSQHHAEVKNLLHNLRNHDLSLILEDSFGLGWGNRFEDQALRFIPVFMETGGTALMALDYLLASRMLRQGKVTGRYDINQQDIKDLNKALIDFGNQYNEKLSQSLKLLANDLRRKERGL